MRQKTLGTRLTTFGAPSSSSCAHFHTQSEFPAFDGEAKLATVNYTEGEKVSIDNNNVGFLLTNEGARTHLRAKLV